ncbi:MAG: endolytic transglycosylase MltG [Pyrinomonadaceae bacterium]
MKRLIALVILILIFGGAGAAFWIYKDLRTPVHHTRSGQYIEIPRGSAPATVVRKLLSEGIIKHEWSAQVYLKLTGAGPRFRAGEYDFPSPISPISVFTKLQEGEQRLIRMTVIEGWTRWDIANAMAKIPELKLADADSALKLMSDARLVTDLDPQANNLEGYLYPATYEFPPNTSPTELLSLMVKRFREVWKPGWSNKSPEIRMSPRQIVTAASLIETEAKLETERQLIASVIYNRLKLGMPLGIDSTVIYASKLEGKWRNDGKVYKSDVERRSPYNTRLHTGLPPGPIASPGESSLKAALSPAQTDYLYYVREPSRNDGAHNFYANERDFGSGVQALRGWEQQRDLENARKKAQEK